MGAPGPPGGYDLHKYFRGPAQSPYPPQSGYQPTSPGYHQPSHSSYPPSSNNAASFGSNPNAYSNLPVSNYAFNASAPQQSGSPVYHGQQFGMHYNNQDHGIGIRSQGAFSSSSSTSSSSSAFGQQTSTSAAHSNQRDAPCSLPLSSSSMPKFALPQSLPSSPASSQPLDGARLMALLTTQQPGSQQGGEADDDDSSSLIPGAPHSSPRRKNPPSENPPGAPPALSPALPTAPPVPSARFPAKPPKGRYLRGDHIVYDIDMRRPGEAQPQLEVSPITVYSSDPSLVLGRQIAVNKKFICYGLRGGTIRILNINSAQKTLLRGHTQRVSDMAFFSENAPHLLASASEDGRIFVRRIHEGSGEEGKLTENILLAVQLVGDWESCHPRLCRHPTAQDVVFVAIGRYVVAIDMSKAEQCAGAGGFNAEHPVVCRLGSPLKGISVAAQHDDVVTDLDVPLSAPFRLVSASKDGTIRIWGDQKQCHSMFEPYEGHAVDAVSYISAPHQSSDRQFLITGGPLNQSVKLWALDETLSSKSGAGAWKCTQALEFQSSGASKSERAFFNQMIGAPRAGLLLVANAERHAIYVIHIDFASANSPRMDYLAEFAVAIPILSLTVAEDAVRESGEGTLKVFCVQTQAIQQHALDLSQCTPPEDPSEGSSTTPSTTPKKGLPMGGTTKATTTTTATTTTQAPSWIPPSVAFAAIEKSHQNLTTTATGVTSNSGIPPRPTSFGSLFETGSRYLTTEANRVTTETTKSVAAVATRDAQDAAAAGKATSSQLGTAFEAGSLPSSTRLNARTEAAKPPTPPPCRQSRSRSPARVADMPFVSMSGSMYSAFSKHNKAEKTTEAVKEIWPDGEAADAPPTTPVDTAHSNNAAAGDETYDKEEREGVTVQSNPKSSAFQQFRSPHLISPSEIMSLAAKGDVGAPTAPNVGHPDLTDVEDWQDETQSDLKKQGGSGGTGNFQDKGAQQISDSIFESDVDEPTGSSVASLLGAFEGDHDRGTQFVEKDMSARMSEIPSNADDPATHGLELPGLMAMAIIDDSQNEYNFLEDKPPASTSDAESQDESLKGGITMAAKRSEAAGVRVSASPFATPTTFKGRKSKNKNNGASGGSQPLQGSASSQPSAAPATSLDPGLVTQVATMQESLSQLVSIQRELQKQMTVLVAVPVAKEAKRLEGAFGQRMEKVVKANVDAMWARLADENAKREKQDCERAQQVSTLLSNFVIRDLPVALERGLKKEIAAFGPAVAQSLLLPLQKSVSTGVTETFQSAIEKFLPQLEKTTVAKLEAAVTRQLKTQFQTSGRQTLQEALRSGLESLVIPAFERSCQAMSEQLDTAFQTGMAEHTSNAQQQFASTNTALATILQEAISSVSGLAKVLNEDLLDSTAKLMELVETAGANVLHYGEGNQSKGGLPAEALSVEHVEQSLDPTIELNRLIKEGNFEEAFNRAFSSGDLQVVSWLCLQLDPSSLLSTVPLPVSQVVLLSLVRHVSFDLPQDTGHKLLWIKEAALALNPDDPRLVPHMRAYLEQTYQNCHKHMGVTKVQSEQSMLRLVIHLINSLLSSCN